MKNAQNPCEISQLLNISLIFECYDISMLKKILRDELKKKNKSLFEFAKELSNKYDISQRSIYEAFSGDHEPRFKTICIIAHELKLSSKSWQKVIKHTSEKEKLKDETLT